MHNQQSTGCNESTPGCSLVPVYNLLPGCHLWALRAASFQKSKSTTRSTHNLAHAAIWAPTAKFCTLQKPPTPCPCSSLTDACCMPCICSAIMGLSDIISVSVSAGACTTCSTQKTAAAASTGREQWRGESWSIHPQTLPTAVLIDAAEPLSHPSPTTPQSCLKVCGKSRAAEANKTVAAATDSKAHVYT